MEPTTPTEEQLVERTRQGDKDAAEALIRRGFVNPKSLLFSTHRVRAVRRTAPERIAELTELARLSALFRSHPEYAAPNGLVAAIETLLSSGRHELLSEQYLTRTSHQCSSRGAEDVVRCGVFSGRANEAYLTVR